MVEEKDRKIILEREYIVPLRAEWLKVPNYRRAEKAVKALKEFMVKHMKVYDRDLRKIKIDVYLNNEIRFKGMKKPLHKIKVKATKFEDGIVEVKLVTLPKHIEFEIARKARKEAEKMQKENSKGEKAESKQEEKHKESEEEQETKEREETSKEAMQEIEKKQAKIARKTTTKQAPEIKRKIMQR